MIYLDTSVLGAVFFRETRAADLVSRLESMRKERLMISAWTLTEMASVGGIKQRTGAVDGAMRQAALANFQRFASTHLGTVEIEPADFRTAAVLIETPAALRAGDALHLAVARRLQARIATLDQRLRQAADTLGLLCIPLED
ncbi:type II toxin-antitoxin system VapC family toxin [Aromatoleum anaerobium]|uniref:PIN domain-containing protein n=1 Tax=Aromatoleum anaerobium TaxID=182180 RepID=A0ABX1PRW0_9RHOO|nr:type II toxin-antitoxin system VapC family toxin [Aromatoleum anaerobium]MCK0506881.1 type II toxin-antitoxin system VapC family toxin [Aromatoleum anaerobium]